MTVPIHVLVADWSKEGGKRVGYRVDAAQTYVARLSPSAGDWTVEGLVEGNFRAAVRVGAGTAVRLRGRAD
jgi:hypothetical protein